MRKFILVCILTISSIVLMADGGLKNLRGVKQELDGIFLREVKYDDWEYIGAEEEAISGVVSKFLKKIKEKKGFLIQQ